MKIEKLNNFDINYIYSMNGPIGRLVDKMHQLIDAFNSLDRPSIEVRTGVVEMCKECQLIPAVLCEKCTKEKEPELLPCPFCYGIPTLTEQGPQYFRIICMKCLGRHGLVEFGGKTKQEAIEAWNKRA